MAQTDAEIFKSSKLGLTQDPPQESMEDVLQQMQMTLNIALNELGEVRKSHKDLESRIVNMQSDSKKKDDQQGELSFVDKPFKGDKNEITEEAICTWLSHWETHFELHPMANSDKIAYVGEKLIGKAATWWRGLSNAKELPKTWDNFVKTFKSQFLQPTSQTKVAQNLMTLSSKTYQSLEDYVYHARMEINTSGLEGEKWFIACLLNGIPNSDYHWIVHDKDPNTLEEAIEIILKYEENSKKDHNKQTFTKPTQGRFARKLKQISGDSNYVSMKKSLWCAFYKAKGHIKDVYKKLKTKNIKSRPEEQKSKSKDVGTMTNIE